MRDPTVEGLDASSCDRPARLKRRGEFLRVAAGRRWHGRTLTLQAAVRDGAGGPDREGARVGFTLTRKVGCAVIRNRVRRRLKEALRLAEALPLRPDTDYVVVGRLEAIRLPFAVLADELARGLDGVGRVAVSRRGGGMSGGSAPDGGARDGNRGSKRARRGSARDRPGPAGQAATANIRLEP